MRYSKLGSPEWLEGVFASEPSRNPRGRSRPTQRYPVLEDDGRVTVAEGGNSSVARSLLTTMKEAGVVRRLKLEPFALTIGEHGVDATPDVIFELTDGRFFVVENKSARYLTEEKLEKLRQVDRALRQGGVPYLLWTDDWPLGPPTWRLMREMRTAGTSQIDESEIERLTGTLEHGPLSVAGLRGEGLYRHVILAAVWRGHAHIDLFEDFDDDTTVSLDVTQRNFEATFATAVGAQSFWHELTFAG